MKSSGKAAIWQHNNLNHYTDLGVRAHQSRDNGAASEQHYDFLALQFLQTLKISNPVDWPNTRQKNNLYHFPLLVSSAKEGFVDCVKFMLCEPDIDILATDMFGNNALNWANAYGYSQISELLIDFAAKKLHQKRICKSDYIAFLTQANTKGFTPVTDALKNGHSDCFNITWRAITRAVQVDPKTMKPLFLHATDGGYTILMEAGKLGDAALFNTLLHDARGAFEDDSAGYQSALCYENKGGYTLLREITKGGNIDIFRTVITEIRTLFAGDKKALVQALQQKTPSGFSAFFDTAMNPDAGFYDLYMKTLHQIHGNNRWGFAAFIKQSNSHGHNVLHKLAEAGHHFQ